jgi:hypothetical protein
MLRTVSEFCSQKGFSIGFLMRMLPTVPGVALAPTTAMDCGWKIGSSECSHSSLDDLSDTKYDSRVRGTNP